MRFELDIIEEEFKELKTIASTINPQDHLDK